MKPGCVWKGIPYTPVKLTSWPRSSTGKVPYIIRADGSTLADSTIIIDTLARELGIDPGYGSTAEERARGHLILRTLEESLYFAAVWERWQHAEYWPTTREAIFGHLPPGLRQMMALLIRRAMRTALHSQGISRHPPAHIAAIGAADLAALSTLLGERPYFNGDRPGIVDASAYGTLANLLGFPHETPLKRAVEGQANLAEFCRRMRLLERCRRRWNIVRACPAIFHIVIPRFHSAGNCLAAHQARQFISRKTIPHHGKIQINH